jgi:hypothetical protein
MVPKRLAAILVAALAFSVPAAAGPAQAAIAPGAKIPRPPGDQGVAKPVKTPGLWHLKKLKAEKLAVFNPPGPVFRPHRP